MTHQDLFMFEICKKRKTDIWTTLMLHRVVNGSTNLESKLACFVLKNSESTERASFR